MNIIGIGTDIVEIERMASKLSKMGFETVCFTENEIQYCRKQKNFAENFAARFAAKEAYMKAIGSGWSNEADFKEIEILKDQSGAPQINLIGNTKSYFENRGLKNIFVSLSHTRSAAVAFVIITE